MVSARFSATVAPSVEPWPSPDPAVGMFALVPRGNGTQLPEALQALASAFTKSRQVS